MVDSTVVSLATLTCGKWLPMSLMSSVLRRLLPPKLLLN